MRNVTITRLKLIYYYYSLSITTLPLSPTHEKYYATKNESRGCSFR